MTSTPGTPVQEDPDDRDDQDAEPPTVEPTSAPDEPVHPEEEDL